MTWPLPNFFTVEIFDFSDEAKGWNSDRLHEFIVLHEFRKERPRKWSRFPLCNLDGIKVNSRFNFI